MFSSRKSWCFVAGAGAVFAQDSQDTAGALSRIEPIVVTAQRRSQNLQDVPLW